MSVKPLQFYWSCLPVSSILPMRKLLFWKMLFRDNVVLNMLAKCCKESTVIRNNPTRCATYNTAGDGFHRLVENRPDQMAGPDNRPSLQITHSDLLKLWCKSRRPGVLDWRRENNLLVDVFLFRLILLSSAGQQTCRHHSTNHRRFYTQHTGTSDHPLKRTRTKPTATSRFWTWFDQLARWSSFFTCAGRNL